MPTETLYVSTVGLTPSLPFQFPIPSKLSKGCCNTYKTSNSHKSFFYHFLFKCFVPATHFHRTAKGHYTHNRRCETFCSSLWFGSNESSVIREGTGTSRIPSFMPHFPRKPDCKHSTPSLPLQDKTQSNNTPKEQIPVHHCADISADLLLFQCPPPPGWRAIPRQAQSQLHKGTNTVRTSAQPASP